MTKTLRWGVLSTAKIGLKYVIPAMQHAAFTEIRGIASRNAESAQQAARELGIPKAYGSYEALLADPEIDAVYNPLPNHLHLPWTLRAMEAGKHVLCEKPLGLNAAEVEQFQQAAAAHPNLVLSEAFMYRHHPQWAYVIGQVCSGLIGRVQTVHAHFSYFNTDAGNIRNKPEYGGGGLLDIGCYCVSSSRWIFGREPDEVAAFMVSDPDFGTDRLASGILRFGDSTATFSSATAANLWQGLVITGDEGRIEIPVPFNPPPDQPAKIRIFARGEARETEIPPVNHFTLQAEHFARLVSGDATPVIPLEESLANLRILDAIRKSAETRRMVQL